MKLVIAEKPSVAQSLWGFSVPCRKITAMQRPV